MKIIGDKLGHRQWNKREIGTRDCQQILGVWPLSNQYFWKEKTKVRASYDSSTFLRKGYRVSHDFRCEGNFGTQNRSRDARMHGSWIAWNRPWLRSKVILDQKYHNPPRFAPLASSCINRPHVRVQVNCVGDPNTFFAGDFAGWGWVLFISYGIKNRVFHCLTRMNPLVTENLFLRQSLNETAHELWSFINLVVAKEGSAVRIEVEKRLFKPTTNSARIVAPNFLNLIWQCVFLGRALVLQRGNALVICILKS